MDRTRFQGYRPMTEEEANRCFDESWAAFGINTEPKYQYELKEGVKDEFHGLRYEYVIDYHKKTGSNHDEMSRLLLSAKEGNDDGFRWLVDVLKCIIPQNSNVCAIPSSKADKESNLVKALNVASREKNFQVSNVLVRVADKKKSAYGSSRKPYLHYRTLEVARYKEVIGQDIILIDDVCTTGVSLFTGKKLLMKKGANSVRCIAIGSTCYE